MNFSRTYTQHYFSVPLLLLEGKWEDAKGEWHLFTNGNPNAYVQSSIKSDLTSLQIILGMQRDRTLGSLLGIAVR